MRPRVLMLVFACPRCYSTTPAAAAPTDLPTSDARPALSAFMWCGKGAAGEKGKTSRNHKHAPGAQAMRAQAEDESRQLAHDGSTLPPGSPARPLTTFVSVSHSPHTQVSGCLSRASKHKKSLHSLIRTANQSEGRLQKPEESVGCLPGPGVNGAGPGSWRR